jgi:ParB-like chromosome segregation protein Spo0J
VSAIENGQERRVRIESVRVLDRHRRDLGDIDALARSIDEMGLINPITLTHDARLIAGERRLAAARKLGWESIPARWVSTLDDVAERLKVERDENICRKDMTSAELASVGAALEEIERPKAAARRAANLQTVPGNLSVEPAGNVTAKVADALGVSEGTYKRLRSVHQVASDSTADPDERDRALEALDAMDKTGQVRPVYDKWKAGEPVVVAETKKPAAEVKRRPLPDQIDAAVVQLRKAVERLEKVVADDRWPLYAAKVAPVTRNDLQESFDRLATVVERIPTST